VTVVGVILLFIAAVLLSPHQQAAVQVVTASSPPPSTSSLSSSSIMKTISGGVQIQNDDDNIDVNVNVNNDNDNDNNNEICIIFSDLDGTLIHYPSSDNNLSTKKDVSVLNLPKSSSGLSGIISAQTLCSIRTIRNGNCGGIGGSNKGVKFVLISGMRTSTFLQRLPFLPKADAYATENGGRIFYPLDDNTNNNNKDDNTFWVKPKRFKGSTKDDLLPFGIYEDMDWKRKMINTKALGGSGNGDIDDDFTLDQIFNDPSGSQKQLKECDGLLWDFARDLIHNKHFILDTKGYSTCFRVNRKHQNNNNNNNNNNESGVEAPPSQNLKFKFEDLYNGKFLNQPPWIDNDDSNTDNNNIEYNDNDNVIDEDGHVILSESIQSKISWSVNLNCVDFYPSISGKKNWYVLYILYTLLLMFCYVRLSIFCNAIQCNAMELLCCLLTCFFPQSIFYSLFSFFFSNTTTTNKTKQTIKQLLIFSI
jgi:hydroxymethylpyrimidine pyrophosphatase-like HAD family hydrolase